MNPPRWRCLTTQRKCFSLKHGGAAMAPLQTLIAGLCCLFIQFDYDGSPVRPRHFPPFFFFFYLHDSFIANRVGALGCLSAALLHRLKAFLQWITRVRCHTIKLVFNSLCGLLTMSPCDGYTLKCTPNGERCLCVLLPVSCILSMAIKQHSMSPPQGYRLCSELQTFPFCAIHFHH